ncbi:hypothetical protein [Flavobacterium sp. WC2409]|uniref:Uncharacterized protein n=2 Tax=unclassified Flavobacterium TaxID=196869 RepID=A0AB39WAX4_9FLAO
MKNLKLVYLIFIITFTAYGQNDCDKALEFQDEININNSGKTVKEIHTWLKSSSFREYASSFAAGGGVEFPIDGIPVGFDASTTDTDYQKLYDAIDKGDSYFYSNEFKQNLYKKTLKEKAYDVWLECIKLKTANQIPTIKEQNNIIGEITNVGDDFFILKLKWKPTAGINTVKLKKPIIIGAECVDNTLFNNEISSEFISIPFYRDKQKEVQIILNTNDNRGSFSLKLPKANQIISVNTEINKLPKETFEVNGVRVIGQFTIEPISISFEIDAIRKIILSSELVGTIKFNVLDTKTELERDKIPESRQLNLKRVTDSFDEQNNWRRREFSVDNINGLEFSKKFYGKKIKKSIINNDYNYSSSLGQSKRKVPAFNEETKWSGERNYKIYITNIIFTENSMNGVLVIETGFPYSSEGVKGQSSYIPFRDTGKTTFKQSININY